MSLADQWSGFARMLAAAAQIKEVLPTTHVLMYNPIFPLVIDYSYAEAIAVDYPEFLLRWPNKTLWEWSAAAASTNGGAYIGNYSRADWRVAAGLRTWGCPGAPKKCAEILGVRGARV